MSLDFMDDLDEDMVMEHLKEQPYSIKCKYCRLTIDCTASVDCEGDITIIVDQHKCQDINRKPAKRRTT